MKRRPFITKLLKFMAGYSLASFANKTYPPTLLANDEKPTNRQMLQNLGSIKLLMAEGQINSGGRLLYLEDEIGDKSRIETKPQSSAVFSLKDGSLIKIYENSLIELIHNDETGMIINLIKGALRFATNTEFKQFYPYLIHTSNSNYVIRNAVFFYQIIDQGSTFKLQNGELFELPSRAKEYACICRGMIDFLTEDLKRVFQTTTAKYHNAFFVVERGKYLPAPILNHDVGFSLLL